MTNTSKFWTAAVIVGAVAAGAAIANNDRVEAANVAPQVALAPPEASEPAATKAALPLPTPRKANAPLSMSPGLATLMRPLLQRGTDLTMASEGFTTSESFVATAHAAKNLGIPFVLLKDRVVARRQPLATAIRELRPGVDAKAEAARAISAARSEIALPTGS